MNVKGLQELRIKNGVSLQEMAIALGFKTAGGYKRIETGENKLKAEHLPIIASRLGVPINLLVNVLFFEIKLDDSSSSEEKQLKQLA